MRRYFGPCKVTRKISDVTYEVETFGNQQGRRKTKDLVHICRMKPYLNPEDQEDHLEEDPEDDSPNLQEEDIPTEQTQQPQTREEILGSRETLERNFTKNHPLDKALLVNFFYCNSESAIEALRAFRTFRGIRSGKETMSCYSLRRMIKNFEKNGSLWKQNFGMEDHLHAMSEDTFTAEYESVCEYEDNISNNMTDYKALVKKDDVSTIRCTAAMHYRLPKLEFKKFGGEPRGWITFWSQFSTIDRDPQMPPETKFQYLFQATAENSEAGEAVESFPPSADNYPKVIDYIKSHFEEDEMLVEIYVRDLLQNVLQNVRAEGKTSVVKLYDRLETQLRALETLGVARDKFAAMLYPLVESALPEDTLRVWERSQYTASGRGVQDKLTQLMDFEDRSEGRKSSEYGQSSV
ncbi:hypothetical protein LAZ67_X002331 [Cordylochernes scorpioides]|uniref:Integrase p58-like C-terminal domain-containing protein n=1 Tax=Cordylochernes scorpioides TaxID=51811 RepID=A0ABY6LT99_9ARAC|nr:hypothetical protein LAZ67_X002331 [Cordylochernes scorpioides]